MKQLEIVVKDLFLYLTSAYEESVRMNIILACFFPVNILEGLFIYFFLVSVHEIW